MAQSYTDLLTQIHLMCKTQCNPALVTDTETISYEMLWTNICKVSIFINSQTETQNNKIIIFGSRSVSMVYSLLGTLQSGNAASIIDISHPNDRIMQYINIIKPCMILVHEKCNKSMAITKEANIPLFDVQSIIASVSLSQSIIIDPLQIDEHQTVLYTFTSGSTGIPKCVMGKYGSLAAFYPHMQKRFNLNQSNQFGMLSGVSHDPIQRDIFTPLYFGATLHIPDQTIILNNNKLCEWLNNHKINVICVTPSLLRIITSNTDIALNTLDRIFTVGEQLFDHDITQMFAKCLQSDTTMINIYGSTETQRAVMMHSIHKSSYKLKSTIPIGNVRELYNGPVTTILLSQETGLPISTTDFDTLGEICIKSPYISNGYYNNETETALKFVSIDDSTKTHITQMYKTGDLGKMHEDGSITWHGRIDNQVKVRGYRIELSEIDKVLCDHPDVKISLTKLIVGNPTISHDNSCLISWIQPTLYKTEIECQNELKQQLLSFMALKLPHYMIPDDIVFVTQFEMNHNNKIDSSKLIYDANNKSIHSIDTCKIEFETLEFVARLLNRPITLFDNLFECGMESIHCVALVRFIKKYCSAIQIKQIYENPSLFQIINKIVINMPNYKSYKMPTTEINKTETKPKFVEFDFNFEFEQNTKLLLPNGSKSAIEHQTDLSNRHVILTGSTGFLGSYILANLINDETINTIHLFVRNRSKLSESMQTNKKTTIYEMSINEIETKLAKHEYNYLIENATDIIHNAAEVNWLKTYQQLYEANVKSTIDLLNFAKIAKHKIRFAFISSTSVFDSIIDHSHDYDHEILIKETRIEFPNKTKSLIGSGYGLTKLMSEELIHYSGIEYIIFRTNYLICDKQQYNWPERDFLVKMLKMCRKIDKYIDYDDNVFVHMMPVDTASKLICDILKKTVFVFINHQYQQQHQYQHQYVNLIGNRMPMSQFLKMATTTKTSATRDEFVSQLCDELESVKESIPLTTAKCLTYETKIVNKYEYDDKIKYGYNLTAIVNEYVTRFV